MDPFTIALSFALAQTPEKSAPPPAPAAVVKVAAPNLNRSCACDCGCAETNVCECASPKVAAKPAAAPALPPLPPRIVRPPAVYRAADAAGQPWEHTNQEFLAQWISQRNARFQPPPLQYRAAPVYYGFSPCATGRCR